MSHPNPSSRSALLCAAADRPCELCHQARQARPCVRRSILASSRATDQRVLFLFFFFFFSLSHRVASYRIGLHRTFTVGEAPAPPPPPPPLLCMYGVLNPGVHKASRIQDDEIVGRLHVQKVGIGVQHNARSQCRMTASFNDGSLSEIFLATRVQNFYQAPCTSAVSPSCILCCTPLVQPLSQHADKLFSVCASNNFRLFIRLLIYNVGSQSEQRRKKIRSVAPIQADSAL